MRSSEHHSVALLHLRLPFLKERASDELNYAQDVIEFLSHMGTQDQFHSLACHNNYITGHTYIKLHLKMLLNICWFSPFNSD